MHHPSQNHHSTQPISSLYEAAAAAVQNYTPMLPMTTALHVNSHHLQSSMMTSGILPSFQIAQNNMPPHSSHIQQIQQQQLLPICPTPTEKTIDSVFYSAMPHSRNIISLPHFTNKPFMDSLCHSLIEG